MSIQIQAFAFNAFQENTFVVSDGQDAVIFDPGCYTKQEEAELFEYINTNGLEVKAILFTHAHIDHILGASYCQQAFAAPAYLHASDHSTWTSVKSYAHVYGFENYKETEVPAHRLTDQQELQFGRLVLKQRAREAWYEAQRVELTSYEFDLLWMLAKNAGQTVKREAIHQQIIGREYDGLDRTVDVRISHLRRKLGDNAETPFRIKTVWGKGYLFVADAW